MRYKVIPPANPCDHYMTWAWEQDCEIEDLPVGTSRVGTHSPTPLSDKQLNAFLLDAAELFDNRRKNALQSD